MTNSPSIECVIDELRLNKIDKIFGINADTKRPYDKKINPFVDAAEEKCFDDPLYQKIRKIVVKRHAAALWKQRYGDCVVDELRKQNVAKKFDVDDVQGDKMNVKLMPYVQKAEEECMIQETYWTLICFGAVLLGSALVMGICIAFFVLRKKK